jgi:hypothetical protein
MSGEKKTLGDYFVLIVLLAPNIIILSLILYGSLRDNSKQSEEEAENYRKYEARKELFYKVKNNPKVASLLQKFEKGDVIRNSKKITLKNGVFCIYDLIMSDESANDLFKRNGFIVTSDKDSLNTVLLLDIYLSEVGHYSGGGTAYSTTSVVYAFDLTHQKIYEIDRGIGHPLSSIKTNSRNKNVSGYGDAWDSSVLYFKTYQCIKK